MEQTDTHHNDDAHEHEQSVEGHRHAHQQQQQHHGVGCRVVRSGVGDVSSQDALVANAAKGVTIMMLMTVMMTDCDDDAAATIIRYQVGMQIDAGRAVQVRSMILMMNKMMIIVVVMMIIRMMARAVSRSQSFRSVDE